MILHQIGNKTKTQIELDQLTGETAIQLRAALITVEKSRFRLNIARATMATCVYLPACPAMVRAYELEKKVESGIQKAAEVHWEAQKIKWITYKPIASEKNTIPLFPTSVLPERIKLKIQVGSLTSIAEVWSVPTGGFLHEWKIAWTR